MGVPSVILQDHVQYHVVSPVITVLSILLFVEVAKEVIELLLSVTVMKDLTLMEIIAQNVIVDVQLVLISALAKPVPREEILIMIVKIV